MIRLGLACIVLVLGALTYVVLAPDSHGAVQDNIILPQSPQQPGTPHIVVLGTSLTAQQSWPARLKAQLADCTARTIKLSVVARPGAGSGWALSQTSAVQELHPDVIVLEFAINDADLLDGQSLAQSRQTHARLITTLKTAMPRTGIILMSTNPVYGLQRLKRPRLARYYSLYKELSSEFRITYLDMTTRWKAAQPAVGPFPDGLHPTPAQADQIYPAALTPVIADLLFAPGTCGPPPQS